MPSFTEQKDVVRGAVPGGVPRGLTWYTRPYYVRAVHTTSERVDHVDDFEPAYHVQDQDFATYSEECWHLVSPNDYAYLTGPREYPNPCPWCGGRLVHHPMCDELHLSWEPEIPFGKHKGKKLSQVPRDYLVWVLNKSNATKDLKAEVCRFLEK